MTAVTLHKDLRPLAKIAKKQGWRVIPTKSGHVIFLGPHGQRVVTASTPSDYRGHLNCVARLRRAGMRIPR